MMTFEQSAQKITDTLGSAWKELSVAEELLNESGFTKAAEQIHYARQLIYDVANTPGYEK